MEYEPKVIPEGINTSTEHPMREFIILVGSFIAIIIILISLLTYSTDYLMGYIPVEKENEWFSGEMVQQFDEQNPTEDDTAITDIEQYLLQLVQQLRREDQPHYTFSVRLIENKTPNAFIIPGGHIFVTTGLLENVKSENGLAMVLAHEMGHQYHRHPLRSAGRGIIISLALLIISGTESGGLAQSFIGDAALLTSLSFSREQEREADATGVELLVKHYGHAGGASEFFEALQNHPELHADIPVFISTHPGVEERISTLRDFAPANTPALIPLPGFIKQHRAQAARQELPWY